MMHQTREEFCGNAKLNAMQWIRFLAYRVRLEIDVLRYKLLRRG